MKISNDNPNSNSENSGKVESINSTSKAKTTQSGDLAMLDNKNQLKLSNLFLMLLKKIKLL